MHVKLCNFIFWAKSCFWLPLEDAGPGCGGRARRDEGLWGVRSLKAEKLQFRFKRVDLKSFLGEKGTQLLSLHLASAGPSPRSSAVAVLEHPADLSSSGPRSGVRDAEVGHGPAPSSDPCDGAGLGARGGV